MPILLVFAFFAASLLTTVALASWPRPGDLVLVVALPGAPPDTALRAVVAAGGEIGSPTPSGVSARFADPAFVQRLVAAGALPLGRRPSAPCGEIVS